MKPGNMSTHRYIWGTPQPPPFHPATIAIFSSVALLCVAIVVGSSSLNIWKGLLAGLIAAGTVWIGAGIITFGVWLNNKRG